MNGARYKEHVINNDSPFCVLPLTEKATLINVWPSSHKAYAGRNPKTGESTNVKPKKLPFFKVGNELKRMVDVA